MSKTDKQANRHSQEGKIMIDWTCKANLESQSAFSCSRKQDIQSIYSVPGNWSDSVIPPLCKRNSRFGDAEMCGGSGGPMSMLQRLSRSLSMRDDFQKGFPWRCRTCRKLCHPSLCMRTEWGGHVSPPITFISCSKIGMGLSEEAIKDVTGLELSDLGLISERVRPRATYSPAPGIVINPWKSENQFNRWHLCFISFSVFKAPDDR